jgi:phage portal protein BeeE
VDSSGRGKEGVSAAIARSAREAYEANGIVFACVAARMALLSEARFRMQSTADMHLFGNGGLSILEYPWPNATSGELWSRLELGDSSAGNAFIRRAEPEDGSDALLVEMRPDCVTIISEEARDTQGRVFKRPVGYAEDFRPLGMDREPQFYTTDEVSHYNPVPDVQASFRGMSWLSPVLREVGADQAMTTYKTEHLRSGAQLGIVVKYAQKLQPGTIDMLRERVQARYGGPANAGKTLVLDQGGDVTVAGSTLEQLQFTALQGATETRIASAASVPAEVIGLDGPRSASGNYELAIRRFADLWARPHWRAGCAVLQHLVRLVNPDGSEVPVTAPQRLWFDVSEIAALREGELARAQAFLVKTQGVAATVAAGYTRVSAVKVADSGDLTQLEADPLAPPPGVSGRQAATERLDLAGGSGRPPQAGVPQDLPGVGKPNLPDAKPLSFAPMPSLPNGARG